MKNHNSATYYSLTGHAPPLDDIRLRDTQELYPAYGSTVARLKPVEDPAVPTFVSFPHVLRDGSVTPGQTASFLGKPFDPFFIGQDPNGSDFRLPELSLPASLPLDRLDDRRGLLRMIDRQAELLGWSDTARGIDAFYDRALTMLASPKVKKAFDLTQEPAKLRDAYGRTTYGQSCLLARRLVEAGVRFVTVYYSNSIGGKGSGGWDTHGDNFNQLKNRLLPITDQTRADVHRRPRRARPARRDPDRLDGRVRPVAQGHEHRSSSAPTAATTGPTATPSCSRAGASPRGPSTARATASAPTPHSTPSRPTTSPPPCSGPSGSTPTTGRLRHPAAPAAHRGRQAHHAHFWMSRNITTRHTESTEKKGGEGIL